jgi:hypothetical protein
MSWPKALATWLFIVMAETVHGILRQLFVAPLIGDKPARQVGVLVGSAIIFAIAWGAIRWIGARSRGAQIKVGLVWVVLMAVFELGLGSALGLPLQRLLADYNLAEGGFMGLGLLFLLFAPLLAAKVRGFERSLPKEPS